jgi:hypothetical protein
MVQREGRRVNLHAPRAQSGWRNFSASISAVCPRFERCASLAPARNKRRTILVCPSMHARISGVCPSASVGIGSPSIAASGSARRASSHWTAASCPLIAAYTSSGTCARPSGICAVKQWSTAPPRATHRSSMLMSLRSRDVTSCSSVGSRYGSSSAMHSVCPCISAKSIAMLQEQHTHEAHRIQHSACAVRLHGGCVLINA